MVFVWNSAVTLLHMAWILDKSVFKKTFSNGCFPFKRKPILIKKGENTVLCSINGFQLKSEKIKKAAIREGHFNSKYNGADIFKLLNI